MVGTHLGHAWGSAQWLIAEQGRAEVVDVGCPAVAARAAVAGEQMYAQWSGLDRGGSWLRGGGSRAEAA